jgi:amino acid adenylation domain-containing protein
MHEPTRTQAEIWAADNLGVEATSYHVPLLLDINGEVSATALGSALRDVVERHEILRTRMTSPAGGLRCDVVPADLFELDVVTDLPAVAAHLGIDPDLVVTQADRRLDLSAGLPIMARLTSMGAAHHRLSVKVHHVAFDDWSSNVFYEELEDRYRAHVRGEATATRPYPVQYEAYCRSRDAEALELELDSLKFWRSTLRDFEPFEIPPLRPRPPRRRGRGQSLSFDVPAATVHSLIDIATSERCTLGMALFAAAQAALARFCDTADVNFGTVIADRADDEAQEVIGPLLNTVVLASDASGDPTLAAMIRRMGDTLLDAIAHRKVPFSTLAREFGSPSDLSRNPLCRVMVQYVSEPRRGPRLEACRSSEVTVPTVSSKYDLSIFLGGTGDGGLSVSLGWDADLFDVELMTGLGLVLRAVIEHMARDASARLSTVPIMTQHARSLLLSAQAGERIDHRASSIGRMVAAQAEARPASPALIADDGTTCTYEELDRRAHRVATHLRSLRLRPEAIVAIFARRSVEQAVAVLGAIEAGVPYLALDPDYPPDRSEFMLRDSRAEAMIVACEVPPELASCVANTLVINEMLDGPLDDGAISAVDPRWTAALIYTSGSTGRPKGAMLTAGDLADRIHDMQREITLAPADRVLWKASSAFDMTIMEVLWPLCFGAGVVIARPGGQSDPAYLVDLMRSRSVTVAYLVPSVAAAIVKEPAFVSCRELRVLAVGGDKVDAAIIHAIDGRLPHCSPYAIYGPTETTMTTSWWRCSSEDVRDIDVVPLGPALSNTRMHVLDDRLELVPSGAVGELCIGGSGVARGYFGRPGLTAERFVPDPFVAGARLYRTGDAVRFSASSGRYQFLGRLDLQVKIGGVRIELGEIENVVRRHPAVIDCAAVVSDAGTPGLDRLVAFVTLASPAAIDDLLAFARGFLPSSACPSSAVVVDEMPLTPNGKIDRRNLARRADTARVDGSPELTDDAPDALQRIWREVLGRPGADDGSDFFESGGSSLLAMHLIGRVREAVQKEVPYSLVFMHPVLGAFREKVLAFVTDPDEPGGETERVEVADDTVVGP